MKKDTLCAKTIEACAKVLDKETKRLEKIWSDYRTSGSIGHAIDYSSIAKGYAAMVRSIKPNSDNEWTNVKDNTPSTNKFHESNMVLCIEGLDYNSMLDAFVGWYNSDKKQWFVGHRTCNVIPVKVVCWKDLPTRPYKK